MNHLRNVVTVAISEDACTGCGVCVEVCPRSVLRMEGNKVRFADKDACMECGACQKNCAFDAITVEAGVGCAAAMINGLLTSGDPEKGTCGCSTKAGKGCC